MQRLDIANHGIVHRADDGTVTIVRPSRNGAGMSLVAVDAPLAERYNLATGDVVEGDATPVPASDDESTHAIGELDYDERDEPAAARGEKPPAWLVSRRAPTETLIAVSRVNGIEAGEALSRPAPRSKRGSYERVSPSTWIPLTTSTIDVTGRILDFAAPLGIGYAGLVYGPHGTGLTRTLRAVAQGVGINAPECLLVVLLIRSRGEEITDWRRRFPEAEIVVCPGGHDLTAAEDTLRVADLTLAAAQRQTELGRDVVLIVDSLTSLWGAMLECEEADAQREADRAVSRHRIREWVQSAGDFHGEGLLGGGLGGSLTIIGSAWSRAIDTEAEEEGEIHPHLRLQEHVLSETDWRVELSGELAADRLFPAVRLSRCMSRPEDRLLPAELLAAIVTARSRLAAMDDRVRFDIVMDAIERTNSLEELAERITGT